jgi:hypothetical protein
MPGRIVVFEVFLRGEERIFCRLAPRTKEPAGTPVGATWFFARSPENLTYSGFVP